MGNELVTPLPEEDERQIWIWDDLCLSTADESNYFAEPGLNEVPVNIRHLRRSIPPEVHRELVSASGRSRLTQHGFELIEEEARRRLYNALTDPESGDIIKLPFLNHSECTFRLRNGMGVCGPYALNRQSLQGAELERWFQKPDGIQISGIEGVDWRRIEKENKKTGKMEFIGVELALDPMSARSLPAGKQIIELNGEVIDYRERLDTHLGELPEKDIADTWIGSTLPHVKMPPHIAGMLSRRVYYREGENRIPYPYPQYRQLNSPLLRPGHKTDWPIRTEIYSPITAAKRPNSISLYFVKASSPNTHK